MLELRRHARRVFRAIQRGERLILTYRGRPVARLEPVRVSGETNREDPIFRIEQFAEPGPGGKLARRHIEQAVYGAGRLRKKQQHN